MKSLFYRAAFVAGLAGVCWVGAGYVAGHAWLALAMTGLIAAFYGMGALELQRFRQATATLSRALVDLPAAGAPATLSGWLAGLHPSLQNAVRLRVEGDRVALPGPALVPYVVGLLVLLGMLGTFLGMVVTLNGAVLALESTTDLQAIRAALSAPVKGLGLAFGTSVAGVCASAMLGLMLAWCRRERVQAGQQLDAAIATTLHGFSRAHQRQAAFDALQQQARQMPEVVGALQALVGQMDRQNQALAERLLAHQEGWQRSAHSLNEQLLAGQNGFHQKAEAAYGELARSVGESLRLSLAESARQTGEMLQPVVQATLGRIAQEATALHTQVAGALQQHMAGVTGRIDATAATLEAGWRGALTHHHALVERQASDTQQALAALAQTFEQRSGEWLTRLEASHQAHQAATAEREHRLATEQAERLQQVTAEQAEHHRRTAAEQAAWAQRVAAEQAEWAQRVAAEQAERERHLTTTQVQWEERVLAELAQRQQQLAATQAAHEQRLLATLAERDERLLSQRAEQEQHYLAQRAAQEDQRLAEQAQREEERLADLAAREQQRLAELAQREQQRQAEHAALTAEQWTREQQRLADLAQREEQRLAAQAAHAAELAARHQQQQAEQAALEHQHRTEAAAREQQQRAEHLAQEQARLAAWAGSLESVSATLQREWQQASSHALAHQEKLSQALEKAASEIAAEAQAQVRRNVAEVHELMQAALEAPRAAATVLTQLRQELSESLVRDQQHLEERSRIMATLGSLLETVQHAATEQRAAIDTLVASSADLLQRVGSHFEQQVQAESARLEQASAQVAAGAVEVASLGEAFGTAVQLFGQSNDKLVAGLERVEGSLEKSMERSDEQLAYYVAQAREIIDLTLMSQKQILEDLQRLQHTREAPVAGEPA